MKTTATPEDAKRLMDCLYAAGIYQDHVPMEGGKYYGETLKIGGYHAFVVKDYDEEIRQESLREIFIRISNTSEFMIRSNGEMEVFTWNADVDDLDPTL